MTEQYIDNNSDNVEEEINIREIALRMWRKWYIFVIAVVLCLSVAVLYILRTPKQYSTQGTLLIRSETKGLGGLASMTGMSITTDMFDINKAVNDELVILQSNSLIEDMVDELSLRTATFYRKRLGGATELYHNEPLVVVVPEGLMESMRGSLSIDIKKTHSGKWKMKFVHSYNSDKTKFRANVTDLTKSVETPWGAFLFIENEKYIDPDYPNYSLTHIISSKKSSVEEYRNRVNSSLADKKANAIRISIAGNNQAKNEAIVNKVIELYQRDATNEKHKVSAMTTQFIDERIALIGDDLLKIESKVEKFRTDNHIANISSQSQIALEGAKDYDRTITNIDIQYSLISFIEDFIRNSDSYELIPSNSGISDEGLSALITRYNSQVLEYLRLTRSTNESNPVVSQLKNQMILNRANILKTTATVKDGLMIRRKDILAKSNEIQSSINDIPRVEREYLEISREQTIKRQLYLFLLQKREEAQLSLSSATMNGKVVDQAYTMLRPVSPRSAIVLIAAMFIALSISCAYVYLYYVLYESNKR